MGRVRLCHEVRRLRRSAGRAVTVSEDGVHDWAEPWYDDGLPEPRCFGSIVRLSYDECESWPVKRRLEDGPSGYSDLAVLPDKTIHCIYERGRIEDGNTACNRFMTLGRFDLDWLTAGRDTCAT